MTDVKGGVVNKNFVGPKWNRLLVGTPRALESDYLSDSVYLLLPACLFMITISHPCTKPRIVTRSSEPTSLQVHYSSILPEVQDPSSNTHPTLIPPSYPHQTIPQHTPQHFSRSPQLLHPLL